MFESMNHHVAYEHEAKKRMMLKRKKNLIEKKGDSMSLLKSTREREQMNTIVCLLFYLI